MAFDPKPSTWLGAGLTLVSHVLGFTTDSASSNKLLTEIVDADADPTTGDIRKLMFALCEMFNASWNTIGATPANLPQKLRFQKSIGAGPPGTARTTYTFTFLTDVVATVADE